MLAWDHRLWTGRVQVGRKLVIFKSAAEAEQYVPQIADQIDIIGYNLAHGPANPLDEQADPLAGVKRMNELARQYDLKLALGPDHRFALSDGVALAPYVEPSRRQCSILSCRWCRS
jgi:hypothetical protein